MSDTKDVEFSIKVTVNKHKNKVLFAQVDTDFADVLLSFLTLPLGRIVKVLANHYGKEKEPVLGSLTTLYNGLSNLDNVHFVTEGSKEMLLNPRSSLESKCRKLKIYVGDNQPTKYFTCQDRNCVYSILSNISMYRGVVKCSCGKSLSREIVLDESKNSNDGSVGAFTIKEASFLISDDLRMVPNLVDVSVMQTLKTLGISDHLEGAELMNVTFRFNEILDLLKGSLISCTPLSDIVFGKGHMKSTAPRSEAAILSTREAEKETTSNSNKKMNLKLTVQESTNTLLFAQAQNDFIDFLSSLLAIPLGDVECLLGGNTCLEKIDNLYKSLKNINGDKYFRTPEMKSRLLNPKLPHGYVSENQILPLSEENTRRQPNYHRDRGLNKEWLEYSCPMFRHLLGHHPIDKPKGRRDSVKGSKMYMVSDDLTVTPLSMTSSLSIMKEMKVPLSDVKEIDMHIGLQEALSILKASLTSTSALTDGLMINPVLKKRPRHGC